MKYSAEHEFFRVGRTRILVTNQKDAANRVKQ